MAGHIEDIIFDEQDANLFLVDDPRLRADALKHSVLPRLRAVMNSAITLIRDIYEIEVLDDSIVSVFPNFREKRENDLEVKYESTFVGLGGQRKNKWPGFRRKDGKPVQILPFRFAFALTGNGLFTVLENGWLKGMKDECFEKILRFHMENEQKINPLCFESNMRPFAGWAEDIPILAPFRMQYQYRIKHKLFDNHFVGRPYGFPVANTKLDEVINNFICFFPVYDSYIQMAKGKEHRLELLLVKLNQWLQQDRHDNTSPSRSINPEQKQIHERAATLAESKTRVMPAIRWQVFQRDQWKCVSCGRGSHDGAILHVDHILPRSRGGLDTLDNLQTLCDICNIGKSNKDATNLRNKARSILG